MLDEIYVSALLAYVEMLEIHIDTKAWNEPFHRKTWEFYDLLFDITHELWERAIDLWWSIRNDHWDCMSQSNRVVQILTTLKEQLENIEGVSKWTENMLYWHIDKLEFAIGSATWFIKNYDPMKNEKQFTEWDKDIQIPKEEVVEEVKNKAEPKEWIAVIEIESKEPLENVVEL